MKQETFRLQVPLEARYARKNVSETQLAPAVALTLYSPQSPAIAWPPLERTGREPALSGPPPRALWLAPVIGPAVEIAEGSSPPTAPSVAVATLSVALSSTVGPIPVQT